jgi:hypothetical protein
MQQQQCQQLKLMQRQSQACCLPMMPTCCCCWRFWGWSCGCRQPGACGKGKAAWLRLVCAKRQPEPELFVLPAVFRPLAVRTPAAGEIVSSSSTTAAATADAAAGAAAVRVSSCSVSEAVEAALQEVLSDMCEQQQQQQQQQGPELAAASSSPAQASAAAGAREAAAAAALAAPALCVPESPAALLVSVLVKHSDLEILETAVSVLTAAVSLHLGGGSSSSSSGADSDPEAWLLNVLCWRCARVWARQGGLLLVLGLRPDGSLSCATTCQPFLPLANTPLASTPAPPQVCWRARECWPAGCAERSAAGGAQP